MLSMLFKGGVNRWRKNWQVLSLVEENINPKIVSIVRNGKHVHFKILYVSWPSYAKQQPQL